MSKKIFYLSGDNIILAGRDIVTKGNSKIAIEPATMTNTALSIDEQYLIKLLHKFENPSEKCQALIVQIINELHTEKQLKDSHTA